MNKYNTWIWQDSFAFCAYCYNLPCTYLQRDTCHLGTSPLYKHGLLLLHQGSCNLQTLNCEGLLLSPTNMELIIYILHIQQIIKFYLDKKNWLIHGTIRHWYFQISFCWLYHNISADELSLTFLWHLLGMLTIWEC